LLCYYRQRIKKEYYSTYYSLSISHKKCTLQACYLNFLMKTIISKALQKHGGELREVAKFQESLHFERRLKAYVSAMAEATDSVEDLWRCVATRQLTWNKLNEFSR